MQNTIYMEMDDLVGNLLITLLKEGYDVDKIPYSLIDEYTNILSNHFQENNIYPYFGLSRDLTYVFLLRNTDKYYEAEDHRIGLVRRFTVDELINMYQGYLSLEVLLVILDEDVVHETCEAYERYLGNNMDQNHVKKLKLN